jgi:hypothetical protein
VLRGLPCRAIQRSTAAAIESGEPQDHTRMQATHRTFAVLAVHVETLLRFRRTQVMASLPICLQLFNATHIIARSKADWHMQTKNSNWQGATLIVLAVGCSGGAASGTGSEQGAGGTGGSVGTSQAGMSSTLAGKGSTGGTDSGSLPCSDPSSIKAQAIAAGSYHTCVLTTTGSVRCWGISAYLGYGNTYTTRTRAPSTDVLTGVQAISAGAYHTCALTTSGGVRCWGINGAGELGDGTVTDRYTPPDTDVLTEVQAIAVGATEHALVGDVGYTCALTTSGGVRCWGYADGGQLGIPLTTTTTVPSADVLTDVKAISAGHAHTCAVTTSGGLRCWGNNYCGQLGNGTIQDFFNADPPVYTPPTTDALVGAQNVAAGNGFTCTLMVTGGVRCWGCNGGGELGDGTTDNRISPPDVDVLTGVRAIDTGEFHTCTLLTTGGVRCWGVNADGQLGDGTTTNRAAPTDGDVLTEVQAISAGMSHTCAVLTNGGVRCWGDNSVGQLGDGTTTNRSTPTPVQGICQ